MLLMAPEIKGEISAGCEIPRNNQRTVAAHSQKHLVGFWKSWRSPSMSLWTVRLTAGELMTAAAANISSDLAAAGLPPARFWIAIIDPSKLVRE